MATKGKTAHPKEGDETQAPADGKPLVSWKASEYLHHEKGASWFAGLAAFGLVLSVVLYFVADWVSALVALLMTGALSVYANRKPEVLGYAMDYNGIQIGGRYFSFLEFRSFAILQEGSLPTISLLPMRRFMPPLTIYFDPKDGDSIVDIISAVLPHEPREPDLVDRLINRIKF